MLHMPIYRFMLLLLVLSGAALACIAAEQYHLGPQDALTITVLHQPDVSGPVTVAPDGVIRLPVVGEINVNGLTIAECEAKLLLLFKQRYLSPEVTVALLQPRAVRIYIFGAVKTPGAFELKDTRNLVGAIAAAGGLLCQSNLCTANLYRAATNKMLPVNITDALAGVESANLSLEVGDVVNVEPITLLPVYLSGDAIKGGLYQVPLGTTVSQLIATAGGFLEFAPPTPTTATAPAATAATATPAQAKPGNIRITLVRGTENIPVNVPALLRGEAAADPVLRSADALRVDSTLFKVYLSGEVFKPGVYMLSQGQGISEAVTLAGGLTQQAVASKTTIAHLDGAQERVDYSELLEKGANHALQEGDRVTIPLSTTKYAVLGMVGAPGAFPLDERHPPTVVEAIAQAKGTSPRAVTSQACIIRIVDGKAQHIPVNLHAVLKKNDLRTNITLKPNDIVYVPETNMPDWSTIASVVGTFYYAFQIF